ncbi:outer membrane lipoprotein carrier protein LolA [Desulfonatronospira thiodismutans ASO3-1]|uniref:Outer membrane lipoprotein carrier protein LolA n=1 Tax=Desulfonatronospira thiodismutans ASO3-1 TaxID=555779 RepID=D6SQB5_9BACT|nr:MULTISPECIES: outer membrane lipoprotein carrier protein LolA [Desulfonatronospira]EFI34941.1 outer membrane lipoprotein carrier protein LolA [Desulfonatronospira thiodismutans ASO3-1]RQD74067.1 MAG: outer membrane lipoprotein carrier protein LolA [Desulfonatronospira sp. MSAO_Bac3]
MKRIIILSLTLILCFALPATASDQEVVDRVQDRLDALEGLKADYVQILTNAATKETQERTGSIYFKKPLQVRWEADAPHQELLVIDQDKVWNYFPDDEVAYEYEVEEVLTSRAMINFISGQAKLTEDFQVEEQGMEDGLHKLKLVPASPEPDLVLAYLWSDDQGLLHRILLVDFFGNGNELRLESMETDPELDREKFEFSPEDVEIREGRVD